MVRWYQLNQGTSEKEMVRWYQLNQGTSEKEMVRWYQLKQGTSEKEMVRWYQRGYEKIWSVVRGCTLSGGIRFAWVYVEDDR